MSTAAPLTFAPAAAHSAYDYAVLDVFAKKWYRAPTAYRMRRQSIAAACQEVALWWQVA